MVDIISKMQLMSLEQEPAEDNHSKSVPNSATEALFTNGLEFEEDLMKQSLEG